MIEKSLIVEKLPFFSYLTDKEKVLIESSSQVVFVPAGKRVYFYEERIRLFYVIDGIARLCLGSDKKRDITLYVLYSGDLSVLAASNAIPHITFETEVLFETDSTILSLDASVMRNIFDSNIHVRCYVHELLTDRFSYVMRTISLILFDKYEKRFAEFLVNHYINTKSREVRITQDNLARATSSARRVVGREIKKFVADGLISYKGGDKIIIEDLQGLKELL